MKDIDVYIGMSRFDRFRDNTRHFGQFENLEALEPEVVEAYRGETTPGREPSAIREVWKAVALHDLATLMRGNLPNEFNFIVWDDFNFMFDRTSVVNTFDIGLCMVSYDNNGCVTTARFQADADAQQMTLVNTRQSARGKVLDHYMRLSQKYEGWPLVEAE